MPSHRIAPDRPRIWRPSWGVTSPRMERLIVRLDDHCASWQRDWTEEEKASYRRRKQRIHTKISVEVQRLREAQEAEESSEEEEAGEEESSSEEEEEDEHGM